MDKAKKAPPSQLVVDQPAGNTIEDVQSQIHKSLLNDEASQASNGSQHARELHDYEAGPNPPGQHKAGRKMKIINKLNRATLQPPQGDS